MIINAQGYSQNKELIDSLQKKAESASIDEKPATLNNLAEALLKESPEKAEYFANQAQAEAQKNNNQFEEARAFKIKSTCYLGKYRYSEAIDASKNALDIFLKIEKIKEVAEAYNQLGNIYKQKTEYLKSLENYNKANDYFKLIKDSAGIASTCNFIGSLYLKQNDFENALKYYNSSLQTRLRLGDSASIASSYFNFALVNREIGNFDEALHDLQNSLSIYQKLKNNTEEANVLNLIGGTYLKKNDYNKAIEHYQKSLDIREKSGIKTDIAASYTNIGLAYKEQNNQQKAFEFLFKALALRKEIGDRKAIAISLNYVGSYYWKYKSYTEALGYYLESLKLSLELEEKAETATAYTNIGNIYFDLNNFEKSLEYFSDALTTSSEINDNTRLANCYLLIGNSYSKLGKYRDALDNYKKALEMRRKLGDIIQTANAINSIGNSYCDMGDFSAALKYFNEALAIRRKADDKTGISTSLNNLGNLYSAMNNQVLALSYFEQALKTAEQVGFTYNIALCSRKIGEIYMASKKYEKALPYLERSVKLGSSLSNLELQKKGHWSIYNYYSDKGDYKKALENYILYSKFNDSVSTSMTNKKLLDLQVNFELSKREGEVKKIENEVALLKKQRQLNEEKDLRRIQTIIVLLVIMMLLLSMGILYYNRYNLKRKAAWLLQDKVNFIEKTNHTLKKSEEDLRRLNNTKDKFFSIMAHDIKNPLGGLISITDLMKSDFKNSSEEEKLEMFEIINKSSHQLYNLLENLLHWSRSQTGKIPFNPIELKPFEIAETNIELLKGNAEKKNIMILNTIDQNLIVKADKEMITLIMRNLISNAIKFTNENGKIMISSNKKDGFVDILVEDNGVGISKDDISKLFHIDVQFTNPGTQNEPGTGLGLILCNEFVQKHEGRIWAESEPGKGSKFSFSLPVGY